MGKDLTNSNVDRQNILNNQYAVSEIKKAVGLNGLLFDNKIWFLKEQLAEFFEITTRTIDNYLINYEDELRGNGYEVLRGKALAEFKIESKSLDANEIDFVNIKASQLGIFDFRAFLNISMLLTESEIARELRTTILDIVIDTINIRTGGGTKYINQRDEDFLSSWYDEENYRKQFTDALKNFVDMGQFKYPLFTDKIYVSIFMEKAKEYRAVLKLQTKDKERDTFYSEILDLVSSFECGFADLLRTGYELQGRKLSYWETEEIYITFENQAHWKPLIIKARKKMASRDLVFRDALHHQLKEYLTPLEAGEFDRFLGEKSKELSDRLNEAKDVMKRLKDRE